MNTFTKAAGGLLIFACPAIASAQAVIIPNPSGGGGGGPITGGSCAANMVATAVTNQGVPSPCVTITSAYIDTSIPHTGVDINTASQVTALHMASPVTVAMGGTALASYTIGDMVYASGATALSKLAAVATGNVLRAGGVTTAPLWGPVNLATDVTGILPTANGGTNNGFTLFSGPATTPKTYTLPNSSTTILTTNAAVTPAQGGTGLTNATAHGVVLGNGTSTMSVTAAGTAGQVFTSNGASADGTFQTITGTGTVTQVNATSPLAGGGFTTSGTLTCATCTTNAAALTAHGIVIGAGGQTTVIAAPAQAGYVMTATGVSTDPAMMPVGTTITETATTTSQTLNSSNLGGSFEVTTASDITLTLPSPSAIPGKTLAISVSYNSTGLVTLSSSNIDGQTSRIMHNGESANMVVDTGGSYWHKESGITIPLKCVIFNASQQSIPAFVETAVVLDTIDTNSGGMANTTTHTCVIKRPGSYDLRGQTGWNQVGSVQLLGYVGLNGCGQPNRTAQAEQGNSNVDNGGVFWKMSYTTIKTVALNDTLGGCAYNTVAETLQAGFTNVSVLELAGW